MRVFISWSGTRSREAAQLLRDWLPKVVNDIVPWVSEEDTAKGGDWSGEITDALDGAEFGIICVTPGNVDRPWLLFEAGALSRQVGNVKSKVAPFLIGFNSKADLRRPLGRFQATEPTKPDMLKLLQSLNAQCALRVPDGQLIDAFDVWWPHFEEPYKKIEGKATSPRPPRRDEREVIEEILQTVRDIQQRIPGQREPSGGSLTSTASLPQSFFGDVFELPDVQTPASTARQRHVVESNIKADLESLGIKFVQCIWTSTGMGLVTVLRESNNSSSELHGALSVMQDRYPGVRFTTI